MILYEREMQPESHLLFEKGEFTQPGLSFNSSSLMLLLGDCHRPRGPLPRRRGGRRQGREPHCCHWRLPAYVPEPRLRADEADRAGGVEAGAALGLAAGGGQVRGHRRGQGPPGDHPSAQLKGELATIFKLSTQPTDNF